MRRNVGLGGHLRVEYERDRLECISHLAHHRRLKLVYRITCIVILRLISSTYCASILSVDVSSHSL